MFANYILRIVLGISLLGLGLFFLRKMFTTKPHKLKKEDHFFIRFNPNLPDYEEGKELYCFAASRSNLVGTVIFSCLIVAILVLSIIFGKLGFIFCIIPLTIVVFITLDEGTKKVCIYTNGIVIKSANANFIRIIISSTLKAITW